MVHIFTKIFGLSAYLNNLSIKSIQVYRFCSKKNVEIKNFIDLACTVEHLHPWCHIYVMVILRKGNFTLNNPANINDADLGTSKVIKTSCS